MCLIGDKPVNQVTPQSKNTVAHVPLQTSTYTFDSHMQHLTVVETSYCCQKLLAKSSELFTHQLINSSKWYVTGDAAFMILIDSEVLMQL